MMCHVLSWSGGRRSRSSARFLRLPVFVMVSPFRLSPFRSPHPRVERGEHCRWRRWRRPRVERGGTLFRASRARPCAGGRAFVPAWFARLIAPARAKAERRAHVSHRFLRVLFSRRREREETGPARMPVPSCRPILARPIPMSRPFQRITSYIVNKQLAAVTGPAEQAPCLEGRRRHACPDSGERGA